MFLTIRNHKLSLIKEHSINYEHYRCITCKIIIWKRILSKFEIENNLSSQSPHIGKYYHLTDTALINIDDSLCCEEQQIKNLLE